MSTSSGGGRRPGAMKIRITVVCAKNLAKKDLFRLPDPMARITVEGTGQTHNTESCHGTLDPKWNQHFDLYVGRSDTISITVWNQRKALKRQGGGFLGCVRIMSNAIERLKDTGYQRLDLCRASGADHTPVCGVVVVSLLSREGHWGGVTAVADHHGNVRCPSPPDAPSLPSPTIPFPWEERRTCSGRAYYVNHQTKSTQWDQPTNGTVATTSSDRHIRERRSSRGSRSDTEDGGTSSVRSRRRQRRSQISTDLPPGYEVRTTQQGQIYFFHVGRGVSTWHDPRVPPFLMQWGETNIRVQLGPIPPGWEMRKTATGKPYYVDHANKTTQFTDPRLQGDGLRKVLQKFRNIQSLLEQNGGPSYDGDEPPPPIVSTPPSTSSTDTPSSSSSPGGEAPPTVKEDVPPKYKKDLVVKLKSLRTELQLLQPQGGHCRLEVSRQEIFEESYRLVMKLRPKDLRKRLMVKFRGEEGLDYGGVAREWLFLLSRQMLDPIYGLFQFSRDDHTTLQINTDSGVNPEHLSYFHFVGRVMGLALFHGHHVDGAFTRPFYRSLLNRPVSLQDIESVDPSLHRSLTWMLENDITGIMDTTFAVEHDCFGRIDVRELKTGGKDIPVNEDSKQEYVKLYVAYRFLRGTEQQFLALQKGLQELIPTSLLKPLDEEELELLLGGLRVIDLNDWKQHTRLKHCTLESSVVKWFWEIMESYSEEMRARVLQFVTGSRRVPLQGFKALQGSTGAAGPRLFTIHQVEAPSENLPKAHTCFNRIDLPPYASVQQMKEKLTQAVEETCGFAVE